VVPNPEISASYVADFFLPDGLEEGRLTRALRRAVPGADEGHFISV
jgi:hypothetical protein